jgi:hypothetical protein
MACKTFYKAEEIERKWLKENAWNSNEKILYKGEMVKRGYLQKNLQELAGICIVDISKTKLVLDECLQLIKFIGNKIGEVEIPRYEENEAKEEWKHKEFGANEYQTDLFFIRNSDRIKLIFNVIKKNDTEKTRYRCKLAKQAMLGTLEVDEYVIDDENFKPYLYLEKMKWIKYKKYARRCMVFDDYRYENKMLKWRTKFILKKRNIEMGATYLVTIYYTANRNSYEMLLNASVREEQVMMMNDEWNYDIMYRVYGLYNNMKKMKNSIKEIDKEIEISDDYDEKFTKYHKKMMIKKQLESMYKERIIKYVEEEKKRRKMEKLFIEDNKFIISKKMWSHLRKQKEKLYLNKKAFI